MVSIYNDEKWIGQKFAMLTILEPVRYWNGHSTQWHWRVRCDCGNERTVKPRDLISGHQVSCGCYRKNRPGVTLRHGMSHTHLHNIWCGMNNRCNPNHKNTDGYGKRGITICEEWSTFENFRDWALQSGYEDGLTIERKDVNGNYCPENCTWITLGKQARNRRTTRWVEYQGRTMSLAEAAEIAGLPYKQVHARLKKGWSLERALSEPMAYNDNSLHIVSLGGPIGTGIGALIGLVAGLITDGLLAMDIPLEEIGSRIQETFEKIAASIAPIIEHIGETFTKSWEDHIVPLWEEIKKIGESLWDLLKATGTLILEIWETQIKPVVDLIATSVAPIVVNVVNTIVDAISIGFSFITDTITNILTILRGVLTFVSGVFTHDWEKAWDGIKTIFGGVFDALGTILMLAMNKVILIINTAISAVWSIIVSVVNTVDELVSQIGGLFGQDLGFSVSLTAPQIPYFDAGGFPETGQLFIAREAGAEMVGSIGGKTAVANNDQIVAAVSQGVSNANDDVVTAIYAVAQQIIAEMREQEKSGSSVDINKAVTQAQRRNARVYGY